MTKTQTVEAQEADDDLGDLAGDALHGVEAQEVLDDTEFTKVRFVGMSLDSLSDAFKIGDEMEFRVRARCLAVGDEARKGDLSSVRHVVKMDVLSVTRL